MASRVIPKLALPGSRASTCNSRGPGAVTARQHGTCFAPRHIASGFPTPLCHPKNSRDHADLVGIPKSVRLCWTTAGHHNSGSNFKRRSCLDLGIRRRRKRRYDEAMNFQQNPSPSTSSPGTKRSVFDERCVACALPSGPSADISTTVGLSRCNTARKPEASGVL